MKNCTVFGVDLAKTVLQVCKISADGELIHNKAMSPNRLRQLLATEKVAIIAMEGCGSSHYWACLARSYGHDVRMISPKLICTVKKPMRTMRWPLLLRPLNLEWYLVV